MKTGNVAKVDKQGEQALPSDVVLTLLCIFAERGKEEVSLSEIQETVAELQKAFPQLGYAFSDRFLYSFDLLSELRDLHSRGDIRQYYYKQDALLPKRFLALTPLGKGRGRKNLKSLPEATNRDFEESVALAIKNYESRWRLWGRKKN